MIDIFTGKTKVGLNLRGKEQRDRSDQPCTSGSGTQATFEKWGLDGAETIQTQEQDSSGTVRKIVAETPGAISYLALSYLDDSFTKH